MAGADRSAGRICLPAPAPGRGSGNMRDDDAPCRGDPCGERGDDPPDVRLRFKRSLLMDRCEPLPSVDRQRTLAMAANDGATITYSGPLVNDMAFESEVTQRTI